VATLGSVPFFGEEGGDSAAAVGSGRTSVVSAAAWESSREAGSDVTVTFFGVASRSRFKPREGLFLNDGVNDDEDDDDDDDDDDEGDDDDDDDDGDNGDDDDGVAAPLVSADSFLSPATAVKLAMSKNNKPESLSRLVPFSSVASVAPWRAMRKAEGVSGSYLSCCL
jgi:hypothetical protein